MFHVINDDVTNKREFVYSSDDIEPQMPIGTLIQITKEVVYKLNNMIEDLYKIMYGERPVLTATTSATNMEPPKRCLYGEIDLINKAAADSCEELNAILEKLGGLEK